MIGGMERQKPCTYDEIRQWPASVPLVQAARAFGLGRTAAYKMALGGTFPARTVKVGRRYRVATEDILAVLGATSASLSGASVSGDA
jgi:predicted DNA-binding transcriptional regulator AlpA